MFGASSVLPLPVGPTRQDIGLVQLYVGFSTDLGVVALVVVVDADAQDAFGSFLTDDVFTEETVDITRRGQRRRLLRLFVIIGRKSLRLDFAGPLLQNAGAQRDAIIADVYTTVRPGKKPDGALRLVAEGTPNIVSSLPSSSPVVPGIVSLLWPFVHALNM